MARRQGGGGEILKHALLTTSGLEWTHSGPKHEITSREASVHVVMRMFDGCLLFFLSPSDF